MTTIRKENYPLPAADLGPENPLPIFREPKQNTEVQHSRPIKNGQRGGERTRLACKYRRPADFLGGKRLGGTPSRTRETRVLPKAKIHK
ncbi:MAG: hypothetical protein HY360_22705, partial [Verrucomicrobia bacterium]|nr:hypothetical protein [Verrucomicrobiota bacterium]